MTARDGKPSVSKFFQVPWTEIHEPGAYVSNETGILFRIPESALKPGHSPLIDVVGAKGEEMVTCISKDPFTPIDKLRLLSSDANIQPTF